MGKFTGVLLVSDFDNTLIYTEEAMRQGRMMPPLLEKNRMALDYFMAEGGRFAVATGRALPSFIRFAPLVPMNAPSIVCNGAVLYDLAGETTLETALLDGEVRRYVHAVLESFTDVAVEAYHISNVIYAVRPNEITRNHERLTQVMVTEVPSLLEVPLPLGKLLIQGERAALTKVRAAIVDQVGEAAYELIYSGERLLELTAKGANKGAMLYRLAAHLGISMEHVYCVGDEANDLSMLTAAAQGFAPANCVASVRASGAIIVADAREGALAEVVSILDQRY